MLEILGRPGGRGWACPGAGTRRRPTIGTLTVAAALATSSPAAAETVVSLQLVLAVDVSASVDDREFAIQRDGIATALRDPAVRRAILASPHGVAIAVMQWSSVGQQAVALDWRRLGDADAVRRLADAVSAMPRRLPGGNTRIDAGLAFAGELIAGAGLRGLRQVIDVSGDGPSDDPEATRTVRDRLVDGGIVINGLPIEEFDGGLGDFYRANVIGGPGAFLVRAADFEDVARAMRVKLLREIRENPLARARPSPQPKACNRPPWRLSQARCGS